MAEKKSRALVPVGHVEVETRHRSFTVRGQRVVLDSDLAEFYGVETRVLNQQVARNVERFPEDFRFQLTDEEVANLKSQFVTSSWGGRRRAAPYVFTEQGALAASGVLRSERAATVSVAVSRAFVAMRRQLEDAQMLVDRLDAVETENDELRHEIDEIKALTADHQASIDILIDNEVQLAEILDDFERTD